MSEVTQIFAAFEEGDPTAASRLLPLVYDELRKLAGARLADEKPGQTLQATALVHEAYVRLVDTPQPSHWNSRGHFFAAAAEAMRRILVEKARHKKSLKAGGGRQREGLRDCEVTVEDASVDVVALSDALDRLEALHPRKAALVKLRYFAGLTQSEAAASLQVSTSTADNDWAYAKSWLRLALTDESSGEVGDPSQ